jgi:DNA-binding NarL/FixJ family response regulator
MPVFSPGDARRVLIVSSHPIFANSLARLVDEAGYQVLSKVADLKQALQVLEPRSPVTVIVDYEDVQPREEEWLPLLQQADAARRVILLTLANNEMIVHEQRRVTQVTAIELKQALDGLDPTTESSSNG